MGKILLEKVNLHNPPMENQIDMKQESELECNNDECQHKPDGTPCTTSSGHQGECRGGRCIRI